MARPPGQPSAAGQYTGRIAMAARLAEPGSVCLTPRRVGVIIDGDHRATGGRREAAPALETGPPRAPPPVPHPPTPPLTPRPPPSRLLLQNARLHRVSPVTRNF